MVNFLASQDIAGASLLEVGGGVGDLQVELLKAGVGHATNVELSAGYEETAKEMIAAAGLTDRMTRHLGDFVEDQDKFEPADIVVLNRVVWLLPVDGSDDVQRPPQRRLDTWVWRFPRRSGS